MTKIFVHAIAGLVCVVPLMGCDPVQRIVSIGPEKTRTECLDKLCKGDVEPSRNVATHVALKLNGQWHIAPMEYFSTGRNGGGFYWPSRHPMFKGGDFPEASQEFRDSAIEIFLGTAMQASPSMYQQLQHAKRASSTLPDGKMLRPGLERWLTQEKNRLVETWYVAADLKEPSGDPPTLACRGTDPKAYRCTTGFMWRYGIGANLRLIGMHAGDWPEIYQEADRVIKLLRAP